MQPAHTTKRSSDICIYIHMGSETTSLQSRETRLVSLSLSRARRAQCVGRRGTSSLSLGQPHSVGSAIRPSGRASVRGLGLQRRSNWVQRRRRKTHGSQPTPFSLRNVIASASPPTLFGRAIIAILHAVDCIAQAGITSHHLCKTTVFQLSTETRGTICFMCICLYACGAEKP